MSDILIAGCGRLGLRYLEGIIKIEEKLNIHIYDISRSAILRAQKFISSKKEINHKFSYHLKTIDKKYFFSLIIISSTADTRKDILVYLSKKIKYKYCILEKVLTQSVETKFYSILTNEINNVWVNTPRKIMPLYKKVKKIISNEGIFQMRVIGNKWGICCNGCHYIDLMSWLSNEKIISINEANIIDKSSWYESKRPNFYDLVGIINIKFSSGSSLQLNSNLNESLTHNVKIETESNTIDIDELSGRVKYNNSYKFTKKILLQSEMSKDIVKNIIHNGICELTMLSEHIVNHNIFIDFLLKKYNESHNIKINSIPIT